MDMSPILFVQLDNDSDKHTSSHPNEICTYVCAYVALYFISHIMFYVPQLLNINICTCVKSYAYVCMYIVVYDVKRNHISVDINSWLYIREFITGTG